MISSYSISENPISFQFFGKNTYTVELTINQPTLVASINDWNLNVVVSRPTLVSLADTGEVLSLNKIILTPTLVATILSGRVFSLNQSIRKPTIVGTIVSQQFFNLTKTIRNITLAASLVSDNFYVFDKTMRSPEIAALWNNDVLNSSTTSTYVINTMNSAHTKYTNFGFNSFFKLANNYYGINSTGVYRLTGGLDISTHINTEVATPISSFDKQGMKACSDAIIFGRLDGDMEVVTVTDEQEERDGFVVRDDGRQGLHRIRAKIPKGLKGSTWQFKLKNVDGSGFSINNLEVFLRELQRIR